MKRPSTVFHFGLMSRVLLLPALLVASGSAQSIEDLRLTVGKSIVLDYPSDVRQISTSDPTIVDAIAVSTREVLLHAKSSGSATVVVWSKGGQRTMYGITVEQNLDPLRRLLREAFPNDKVEIQATKDSMAIVGRVASKDIADRVVALVTPYGKSIVNNLDVAPPPVDKQIMLRVKFAELNRRASQAFGVNIISTGASNTIGAATTGQFSAPRASEVRGAIGGHLSGSTSSFSITDALNIFAFRTDLNLAAFIKALQTENLLQILAEPNLVTTNGKEASFLVGGEFPIPVLQGGGNAGAITIQFREFGIRLTFNPILTPSGTIKMHVKPEVSTIDVNNGVSVSGFLIPALATRRMETDLELNEGQSFVIAGLIDNRVQETLNKIPGLSSIPLLGALFKSTEIQKNLSELVVIVTPELSRPLAPGESAPLPAMPRDFLVPVTPDTRKSSQLEMQRDEKKAALQESATKAKASKKAQSSSKLQKAKKS